MYKEDYVDLNIVNGTSIIRSYVNKHIGEGDELGDVFGVRVYRNGTPVSMSEVSVWGWFIRPDGNTVIIQGEKNGNSVWVKLPEACYVFDGNFTLTIKVVSGDETTTLRVVDGTILDTWAGSFVDPGTIVPSVEALQALIDDAEAAAARIEKYSFSYEVITGTRYKVIVTKAS